MGADGRNVKSISQSRNISAFVPAWSTVFRESIIESGSAAPSSVVNPADAVQIIGGRPVIGSERIRRHARRKVREPRPPQRPHCISPLSRHKCLQILYFVILVEQHIQSALISSVCFLRASAPPPFNPPVVWLRPAISSIPPAARTRSQSKPAACLPQHARSPFEPKRCRGHRLECALPCGTR